MPGTVAGIAFVLLVATPGIVVELLRQRYRPARTDSVFVETGRVIAGGVILSGMTFVLLGLVGAAVNEGAIVDISRLLLENTYLAENLWLFAASCVLFGSVAINLGILYFSVFQFPGSPVVAPESGWVTVFGRLESALARQVASDMPGKRLVAQVQVTLKDGTGWIGMREAYSVDMDPRLREIVLSDPILRINADGTQAAVDSGWKRVVIAGENIAATAVRFSTVDGSRAVDQKSAALGYANRWAGWIFARPPIVTLVLITQLLIPIVADRLTLN